MKLFEVYNIEPQFAWLEPAQGPGNVMGVRLAFIEPIEPKLNAQIDDAHKKQDEKREEMMRLRKDNYKKQDEKFLTPDLGWWMSDEEFHNGSNNFKGFTKGNIFQKYPDLQVYPSKDAAVVAAKKAKII
jgi:hypothetical protein